MAYAGYACLKTRLDRGVLFVTIDHPPINLFDLPLMQERPSVWFGSSPRALDAPSAGNSFAFTDPDARLGYAYVMNKLNSYFNDDPLKSRCAMRYTVRITRRRSASGRSG